MSKKWTSQGQIRDEHGIQADSLYFDETLVLGKLRDGQVILEYQSLAWCAWAFDDPSRLGFR